MKMKLIRKKTDALPFKSPFDNVPNYPRQFQESFQKDVENLKRDAEKKLEYFARTRDLDNVQKILEDIIKMIKKQKQVIESW